MTIESTVNVTQAQQHLPKLLKRDSFAIARHGKIVGFFLSKDRIEALVESMELLSSADFNASLKQLESGKMKLHDVNKLDAAMSR